MKKVTSILSIKGLMSLFRFDVIVTSRKEIWAASSEFVSSSIPS